MFSEELSILDKNTVMMMIEEQNHRTAKAGTIKAKAGAVTAETGNRTPPQRAGGSPPEKIRPFSSQSC